MRQRQLSAPVEIQLLLENPERPLGPLAHNRPLDNIIGNILGAIRQAGSQNRLRDFRLLLDDIPPIEALRASLLLRERHILMCKGFVVAEG